MCFLEDEEGPMRSNKAHNNKPNYSSRRISRSWSLDDNGKEEKSKSLLNEILSSIQRLVKLRIEKMSGISALDQCMVFASF